MTKTASRFRAFAPNEISPSIHWAHRQVVSRTEGAERRLYDFEIMYVISGDMRVHFADDGETERYGPGDLLFLSAAERHRVEIASEKARLMGIHFDFYDEFEITPDIYMVVEESAVRDAGYCDTPSRDNGERVFVRRYASVPDEIVGLMERICEEFSAVRPGYELACKGAMILILSALARLAPVPERTISFGYREALGRLEEELAADMHLNWTNAAMASRLNVSEDHFIRLFKDRFGVAPHRYVTQIRLREAKRCLRETVMTIEQIGRRIGYADLHSFSHAFRKRQGVSPREYRRRANLL
ncbi:helix-turn-helix domain-containing protein [Paenibacillaceae bacterium WGS1546]|uniref:AraC family transcriptional regulator n=1 Tax=Cohnella sp. WGS1546 TaxID=3366810 RepID=UPI00372D16A7